MVQNAYKTHEYILGIFMPSECDSGQTLEIKPKEQQVAYGRPLSSDPAESGKGEQLKQINKGNNCKTTTAAAEEKQKGGKK